VRISVNLRHSGQWYGHGEFGNDTAYRAEDFEARRRRRSVRAEACSIDSSSESCALSPKWI